MKKADHKTKDDIRKEYTRADFGTLTRGKYAARLAKATNIVVLDPEVAKAFPTERAVNDALRSLIELDKSSGTPRRAARRAASGGK